MGRSQKKKQALLQFAVMPENRTNHINTSKCGLLLPVCLLTKPKQTLLYTQQSAKSKNKKLVIHTQ